MTKKEILKLTGLTESEFYTKYPTKESFEKDFASYKKGGIYIKPENRGKFNATKKATGKTTEELTHSKNPLTRKRAIFAQNAKKWKHAEGGEVPNNPGFKALPKEVQEKIMINMAMGGSIGSILGGALGTAIAPGIGTSLGSTLGGLLGKGVDKRMQENKEAELIMNNLNKAQGGFKKGGMLKRADGSYSKRGLWDNIRDNAGSGKEPTKEMLKQEKKIKSKMAKGGKLEHLGDNLFKVKSYIKGTDKVEVKPNVFFDNNEVVRKNPDGSMQILSDDLGYAKPVEKVAKAMGGKAAQSLFNSMYNKQEMSKRPVDKFADNANKRKYAIGGDEPFYPTPTGEAPYMGEYPLVTLGDINETGFNKNKFTLTPGVGVKKQFQTPGAFNIKTSFGNIDNVQKQPGAFDVKSPTTDLEASKFIGETKGKYNYNPSVSNNKLYKMDQISPWWLAASEAGNVANMLMSKPNNVNLERYKPELIDPYRSNRILASELRKQANATSSAIRGTANTQGTYLASEIANRSRLNEAIGSELSKSNLQSLMGNVDIINKGRLANVEIGNMEQDLRQREKDASRTIKSQALSQMGSNAMQYGRDRKQVDITNKTLPFITPQGYDLVENPDGTISFKRKKDTSGSGVNGLQFNFSN